MCDIYKWPVPDDMYWRKIVNEKFRYCTEIARPSSASRLRVRPAQLRQVEPTLQQSIISDRPNTRDNNSPMLQA